MDQYLDAPFPLRGLSVERDHADQPPLTCAAGVNVRAFEPSTLRGRGGNRPGLSRFIDALVPTGVGKIQNLITVVITDSADVPVPGLDYPAPDLVDDPSSPGPPSSWGTGTLYFDPDHPGTPVTGTTLGTRVPSAPGTRPKRQKHLDGYNPGPNVLSGAPPPQTPRGCFQGNLEFKIKVNGPDPFGFNNQLIDFAGAGCMPYNPPTQPAPGTAGILPVGSDYMAIGGTPGMAVLDYAKLWLAVKVGSASQGVCTNDVITNPAVVIPGTCTGGDLACQAPPPDTVPAAGMIGQTINAA